MLAPPGDRLCHILQVHAARGHGIQALDHDLPLYFTVGVHGKKEGFLALRVIADNQIFSDSVAVQHPGRFDGRTGLHGMRNGDVLDLGAV